jgi:molecular chaperone DnaK
VEPILAIDFGTVYSCAALVTGDRVELIHEPSSGFLAWPSSVLIDGGEILIGSVAENRRVVRAPFYLSEIKRSLSRGQVLHIDDADYAPESLVTAVLAAFGQEAERVNGSPVTHAVLTTPAAYLQGDKRNEQMISAGEAAGFPVVELLPEPVAAAYSAPAGEGFPPGSLVLVYDWGGGTFDAALVQILAGRNEVIASQALPYCGGVDIDDAVARSLSSRSEELNAVFTSGDKGRNAMLQVADKLKRDLSDRPDGLQEVRGIEVAMTVAEFEKIAEPFVMKTIECCRTLLETAEYATEALNGVLMAGGSSRIPLVARALEAEFGSVPRTARDPELAVVRGAAMWASGAGSRFSDSTPPDPGVQPLRWDIPDGAGTLMDWLVAEGSAYRAGDTLGRVRLPDGMLWSLKSKVAGVLRAQHAQRGDQVRSGYWLATIDAAAQNWVVRESAAAVAEYEGDRSYPASDHTLSLMAYDRRLYLMYGMCCYTVDLAAGKLKLLCRADKFPVPGLRSLGNLREMRADGDVLRLAAGRTHDTESEARWFEVNRLSGAFIRETTK